jgi:hypothetical protein
MNDVRSVLKSERDKPLLGRFITQPRHITRKIDHKNDMHPPFKTGEKNEFERMKNKISTSVRADPDALEMSEIVNPVWRQVDKSKWMDRNNEFYHKKCPGPTAWKGRGIGIYDGGAEPHTKDDHRKLDSGKCKTEKKALLSPS